MTGADELPELDERPQWQHDERGEREHPADELGPWRVDVADVLEAVVLHQREQQDALQTVSKWRRGVH